MARHKRMTPLQSRNGPVPFLLLCGVIPFIFYSSLCAAGSMSQATNVVVSIEASSAGGSSVGSGIILGYNRKQVFIATALHVLVPESELAESVDIRFSFYDETFHPSSIEQPIEDTWLAIRRAAGDPGTKDTALLEVPMTDGLYILLTALDLHVLGPPHQAPGDAVGVIGSPNGRGWTRSHEGMRFQGRVGESLRFESQSLTQGYSGGGLFDKDWNLIGMIMEFDLPVGRATRIQWMVNSVKDRMTAHLDASPDVAKGFSELDFSKSNLSPLLRDLSEEIKDGSQQLELEQGNKLSFSAIDLNRDGTPEAIVQIEDDGFCGSGGCTFRHIVYKRDGETWKQIGETSVCGDTLSIARTSASKGYSRIICGGLRDYFASGMDTDRIDVYDWDGQQYIAADSPTIISEHTPVVADPEQ